MSIRNPDKGCRRFAVSHDRGATWSPVGTWSDLPDPACNGDLLRYSLRSEGASRDRLLHSIPADTAERRNVSVALSYDEGRTWPVRKTVWEGPAGYSSLTRLADGGIGLPRSATGIRASRSASPASPSTGSPTERTTDGKRTAAVSRHPDAPIRPPRHANARSSFEELRAFFPVRFRCYTSPEKPMKAMARMLAVMSAMGTPRNAAGTSSNSSRSRIPAKSTSARPNPRAVATE